MIDLQTRYDTQTETVHRYQRENFRLKEERDMLQGQVDWLRDRNEELEAENEKLRSPQYKAEQYFGGQG